MPVKSMQSLSAVKGYLLFTLIKDNEQRENIQLEFRCAEDIETALRLFHKKQWEELFNERYEPLEFMGAEFSGIRMVNDDETYITMGVYEKEILGVASFDSLSLKDKNADKMRRIVEIAQE